MQRNNLYAMEFVAVVCTASADIRQYASSARVNERENPKKAASIAALHLNRLVRLSPSYFVYTGNIHCHHCRCSNCSVCLAFRRQAHLMSDRQLERTEHNAAYNKVRLLLARFFHVFSSLQLSVLFIKNGSVN